MAKATKRTKVRALPKAKRELTGKDMRKVKGGGKDLQISKSTDKSTAMLFQK